MSALLSADDLNDFISPGLACIKPVESLPPAPEDNEDGEVEIEIDTLGNATEVGKDGSKTTLSAAQISLADCLACSGCVTSAEEVLVAQHSHDQLLKALLKNKGKKVFVASVSHQTRSSLAVAFNKTIEQVDRLLINLFINQMGFLYVVGTSLGRKLSLLNESRNIMDLKKSGFKGPILSSICPGWVLYAEKTHPYILPRISTVKSAQQITGCLLKALVSQDHDVSKLDVYHLSVMPCFDKKLESARKEENENEPTVDVDCVLTAKELVTLIEELDGKYSLNFSDSKYSIADAYGLAAPRNWPFLDLTWSSDAGSTSGGYAYSYLENVKNTLISNEGGNSTDSIFTVETISGRNSDITELRLIKDNSQVVATAAIVNGFRNIQNLVRKLKPEKAGANGSTKTTKVNPLVARRRARKEASKEGTPSSMDSSTSGISVNGGGDSADASKCDYVEIMACPGGCINGGGQISAPSEVSAKEWISASVDAYHEIPIIEIQRDSSSLFEWTQKFCDQFGINQDRLLRTWFKEVEKPTDPNAILLGAKW